MYEKELEKAQERLNAALTLANKQPVEAINMIQDMQKWVDENIPNDTNEYLGVILTYNEVMGDLSLRMSKFVEAEGFYKQMVQAATKLNERDHEKYDIKLAIAYCKLANNCATNIGCHVILQQPRVLDEKRQRPYDAGENFYKYAINVIEDNCKKGSGNHLEIRAKAINSLATMNAAIGRFKEAIAMFDDAVKIMKAIYQAVDNKNQAVALAQVLTNEATVCTLYKNNAKAQECLEDAIYVLKEHEEEDAVRSGIFLARAYMNLGGTMLAQQQELDEIDEMYDKATNKISMVNAMAKAALPDEASCYMLSGQYFKATERVEKGTKQLEHALEIVNALLEQMPQNQQFINMKQHIINVMENKEA